MGIGQLIICVMELYCATMWLCIWTKPLPRQYAVEGATVEEPVVVHVGSAGLCGRLYTALVQHVNLHILAAPLRCACSGGPWGLRDFTFQKFIYDTCSFVQIVDASGYGQKPWG
jgi:hypothetical protein